MKKGSLTVFSALCMMLVISALFVLLEAARVYGLNQYSEWKSEQGMEYAAAEYQSYLWKEYRLLMLDGGYGTDNFDIGKVTGRVQHGIRSSAEYEKTSIKGSGVDFFQLKLSHIYEPEYLLVTDEAGEVFLDILASYMKKNFSKETAKALYEKYQNQQETQNNELDVDEAIETAKNSIQTAKEETENKEVTQIDENPLDVVQEIKSTLNFSLLGMVIGDSNELSVKSINSEEMLENRELKTGTMEYSAQSDWYRKILALEYAAMYCSHYGKENEEHFLNYELEYIIGGESEEQKNLEEVVKKLLFSRTAANITYLLGDTDKMAKANAIAMTLAGFSGNPAIIKAVEIAVVGSWAFLEGVQDVRALLMGGKIALIKTAEQWTTNLSKLKESFEKTSRAKECENGWKYEDYLKQMLFLVKDEILAYRILTVMEQNLRGTELYKECRMDHMIISFDYKMEFSAAPLFSTLSFIQAGKAKEFIFNKEKSISYMP